MKDVAREAGVALGTVSKVFNDIPVGESYRLKVEEAARRLGYRVNSYARGLRADKTYTVALILPSLDHPFFALLADHICVALNKHNYRMVLDITKSDPHAEMRCIRMIEQDKVDGVIGLTYAEDLQVDENLPYVSIDRFIGANIPCVSSDNFGGGRIAAERLTALGCRRPLFLRLGSDVPGETDKRGAGFVTYCQINGVDFGAQRFIDRHGVEPVYDFLEACYRDGKLDYDGIFCSTDLLACQVIRRLRQLGVRVPEDVQVIGFDGLRRPDTGEYYCSTIVQPIQQVAETAVYILLNSASDQFPGFMSLPVTYAPGGTTRE
ncbi:MAG: LacI family DNA-binding transcriptional regulator [Clostridia bacterium]|nr:LacI family DNA-binding transcriptional regulator [Clostridia bacterium]